MTWTIARAGKWLAVYAGRDNKATIARDALGRPIECETAELALSVARYRRRRLFPVD